MIHPEAHADFVVHMEDVLAVCPQSDDVQITVLCMDDQPVLVVDEVKVPITVTKDLPDCAPFCSPIPLDDRLDCLKTDFNVMANKVKENNLGQY